MPGRESSERSRAQLLDAALAVAVREGLDRLTVADVAAEAGLSKALVFFHFATKDALLAGLLDRLLPWVADLGSVSPDRGISLPELLRHQTDLDQQDRDRVGVLLQFWTLGARRPDVRRRLGDAVRSYEESLRPVAAQALRDVADPAVPGTPTEQDLAALVAQLVFGRALFSALDPDEPGTASVDALVALLRPRGGTMEAC